MSIKLIPYLTFNGNTKEAMEYYKGIFGGELKLTTFGEFEGMPVQDDYKDKIMHAELESTELTIMASEGRPGSQVKFGDNVSLSFSGNDKDKLVEYFDKLAEGGSITMPLAEQGWGDLFGMVDDKYGIHWMVNVAKV